MKLDASSSNIKLSLPVFELYLCYTHLHDDKVHTSTLTMLVFRVTSQFIVSRLYIIILKPNQFSKKKKPNFNIIASFSLIFITILTEKWSGFHPTSGQIPPTSGYFHWLNWDPHMAYTHLPHAIYI